jgi:cell division septal protein FtsQ
MSSLPWANKPERKPRRSGIRLERRYDQAVAQERLHVRSRSRARSGLRPRIVSFLLALGLLATLAYVFLSDTYYVYEATVSGNALLSAEEVFQQTAMQGYSIFFIDPRVAEQRITMLPDIRQAKVTVSLPRQMVIEVREREARVVWQAGEVRYGVDEEGLTVSLPGDIQPAIVIADLDATSLGLGDQVDSTAVAAAEIYHSLLPQASQFQYSREHGLSYQHEHGWRVHLGDGEGAGLKVAIVDALEERLANQTDKVEYIDVRFPESPVYQIAQVSTEEQ